MPNIEQRATVRAVCRTAVALVVVLGWTQSPALSIGLPRITTRR